MRYVILANPIPLMRARHGNRRTWDAQKQEKLLQGLKMRALHDDHPMFKGPIHLIITFYISPAQSISQRRKEKLEEIYHITRPDLSNLVKFIEDVATGILYHDDCIIAKITSEKRYSVTPRIEFELVELTK